MGRRARRPATSSAGGRSRWEAAAQAHRPHLAEVADVATFAEVATLPGATLAHLDGGPPAADTRTVLVGPEGGWSPAEEAAVASWVRIGPHVLRAETAALVAGALAVGPAWPQGE